MNSKLLIPLSLVICAILGFVVFDFLSDGEGDLLRSEGDTTVRQADVVDRLQPRRSTDVDRNSDQSAMTDDAESIGGSDETASSGVPNCQVSGRVVNERGTPIADVRVALLTRANTVALLFDRSAGVKNEAAAVTDDLGRFVFPKVEYWSQWTLRMVHATHQARRISVDVSARDLRIGDIKLDAGAALRGRVIDEETGDPVADAKVVASIQKSQGSAMISVDSFGGPPKDSPSAMTDARGVFEITGLGGGRGRVYVDHEEYCQARSGRFNVKLVLGAPLLEMENDEEVVVELLRGGTLTGRVADESGQPIAMARIVARREEQQGVLSLDIGDLSPFGSNRETMVGETNADGLFAIGGLPKSKYSVQIAARRFATQSLKGISESDRLDVEMKRSGVLWGIATDDASGQPIVGPVVVVRSPITSIKGIRVFLSSSVTKPLDVEVLHGEAAAHLLGVESQTGLFAVCGLPTSKLTCEVKAEGYCAQVLKELIVPSGEFVEIHPKLAQEAIVSGVVLDHLGKPVAGASVPADLSTRSTGDNNFSVMRSMSTAPRLSALVRTDANGRFVLKGLVADELKLSASHPLHLDSEMRILRLQSGEHLQDQVLELGAAGSLSGQVFDQDGQPLAQGVVKLSDVEKDSEEIQGFGLDLGGTRLRCVADQAGEFRLIGIVPGVYRAVLSAPQSTDDSLSGLFVIGGKKAKQSQPTEVTIVASEETRTTLSLQSSCSIEGRVTAGGVAVAGARLRLRGNDSSFFFGPETGRSANTDTDGRYRLGDVEPGDYDLSITAPNVGVPIVVRVSLSAGQSLVKDVELPLGVISGTVVTQGSGKPRADIRVRLTPDTGDDSTSELFSSEEIIIGGAGSSPSVFSATVSSSRRSTAVTTDERGYYEFLHVAPGIYRVSISGGDVIRTSKDHLEVSEGGKLENVNFVAASGSSLTIEASSSEGPPKHFLVTLEGVDPLTYKGETDFLESGKSTTIDGLAPGQYLLRVRRPGRLGLDNSEPRRIQITSGSHQTVTVGD